MKKKYFSNFIKENKWILGGLIFSIFIVGIYLLLMECPEWFNLLFQLAIGYIINFMFYITQVYIPNTKRSISVKKCIYIRVQNIVTEMNKNFTELGKRYLNSTLEHKYTVQELQQILNNLNLGDFVSVINASSNSYFTVKEWIRMCITQTENEINNLYTFYPNDISAELMKVLEEILKSNYHKVMPTILACQQNLSFSQAQDCFFSEYYRLLLKLKDIGESEYNYL